MTELVNVHLHQTAQVERADPQGLNLSPGDEVVVETDRGPLLGRVISRVRLEGEEEERLKLNPALPISRKADPEDQARHDLCLRLVREAHAYCRERIKTRQMEMRLAVVERALDGSRMTFYFTAEGRVDFRALVKDLAGRFRCRVEMRQVGVRNETKLVGGVGSCGRELCCCTFMRDFTPVSVKMAKEQNLSLNPNKISGLCGRLMCCLAYEFPVYMDCKKHMPKVGRRVNCPDGTGKVVRQNVMANRITVNVEGKELEYDAFQVEPAPPLPPPPPSKKPPKGPRKPRREAGEPPAE